jgi:hypothetical protein
MGDRWDEGYQPLVHNKEDAAAMRDGGNVVAPEGMAAAMSLHSYSLSVQPLPAGRIGRA